MFVGNDNNNTERPKFSSKKNAKITKLSASLNLATFRYMISIEYRITIFPYTCFFFVINYSQSVKQSYLNCISPPLSNGPVTMLSWRQQVLKLFMLLWHLTRIYLLSLTLYECYSTHTPLNAFIVYNNHASISWLSKLHCVSWDVISYNSTTSHHK